MSISSGCRFFTVQLGSQFSGSNMEVGRTVSHVGDTSFKKRKMCEYTDSNGKIPVATANPTNLPSNLKIQLCRNFMGRRCAYGSQCSYAHCVEELRKHSCDVSGLVVRADRLAKSCDGVFEKVDQSRFCRMFYLKKECSYGDNCRFRHIDGDNNRKDVGFCGESSAIRMESSGRFVNSMPILKKRRLCNNFEITGQCRYGSICIFAHGRAGLQITIELEARRDTAIDSNATFMTRGASVGDDQCQWGRYSRMSSLKNLTKLKLSCGASRRLPTGSKYGFGTSHSLQAQGTESMFNCKEVKKICGIYADWIEDTPLLHSS